MGKTTNTPTPTPASTTASSSDTTESTNAASSSSAGTASSAATPAPAPRPSPSPEPASAEDGHQDPQEPAGGTASTQDDQEGAEGQQEPESGNREAARYRRRLRETETERDALAAKVESYQRAQVLAAATALAAPADLFDVGRAELTDLLTEDGEVDAAAVKAAAAELIRTRPGLAAPVPRWGDTGTGTAAESVPAGPSWQSILAGDDPGEGPARYY